MATKIVIELWADGIITEGLLQSIATRASEDVFRVNNDPVLFIRRGSYVEDISAVRFGDEYEQQVLRNIVVPAHYKQTARASVTPTANTAPMSHAVDVESARGYNPSTGEKL
jgi:hypothetical protein